MTTSEEVKPQRSIGQPLKRRSDVLVFTDANAILAPGTLRSIASNFADARVGGVSANERREPGTYASSAGLGERLYWEYDKWIKKAESRIGSIVSASGSLYAIRRELFRPIVDPSATDDFAISTQVVRAGYRLVFESDAVTWEPPVAKDEIEYGRKVRIVTRGLRSVWGIRELLLPWRGGFYSVQLWSHKVVRRLVGGFTVGIFVANLSLLKHPFWRLVMAGQFAFYGLALAGWRGAGHRLGAQAVVLSSLLLLFIECRRDAGNHSVPPPTPCDDLGAAT